MRSIALFKPTFQRLQLAFDHMDLIKRHSLPLARGRTDFERLERTFLVMNGIQHTTKDLQSSIVDQQLAKFQHFLQQRSMTASYDYEKKGFRIVNSSAINDKISKLGIDIRSCVVQKIDHPLIRDSLYFHELKDMEKYFKIQYPRNAPNFMKEIYRHTAQNQLLDFKNPLGLPLQAPNLHFMVQLNELFTVELYCRFGYINIKTVRLLKKQMDATGQNRLKCHFILDGFNLPRNIQKTVYNLCQEVINLGEPQLFQLHKLAYIGGRVEEIESLLNLFENYAHSIEEE